MNRITLILTILFGIAMLTAYGQEKKAPVTDSQQKKASLQKQVKTEMDTTLRNGKKRAKEIRQQIVDQKNKTKADVKEIYQTVFIARDTSLLKEETIKISSELANEKKKIKSSMQGISPTKLKGSLEENGKGEIGKIENEMGDQKQQVRSTLKSVNPKNLDDGARQEGQKQLAQVNEEKEKMKVEIKKPVDFDLKMDNNGMQGKSLTQDNLEQKLKEIKDFKLDGKTGQVPGSLPKLSTSPFDLKNPTLREKIPSISDIDTKTLERKVPESKGVEKLKNTVERVSALDSKGALGAMSELSNVKTILPQKQLMKLRDSLGLKKFDSLFNKASLLSKREVGKEDLLQALNKPFAGKSKFDESSFDQKSILGDAQKEITDETKGFDPLSAKLPQPVLEKLAPLSGNLVDSKYIKAIDSLRKLKLNEQGLKLKENKISKDLQEAVFKKKPKFWDRAYFDGILGIIGSENATIVQASPSLGYHILPLFSVGLGPTLSIQKQDKSVNSTVGFRSFAKVELLKQRAYLQTEYQVSPNQIDYKNIDIGHGNFLIGGGAVKSLFGKIAINLSLLYRLNTIDILPGASPWVFRMGISTVKVDK